MVYPPFSDHRFRDANQENEVGLDLGVFDRRGLKPVDCIDIRLLREAAKHHNFTVHLQEPKDGLYGFRLENGSWNGVIQSVIDKTGHFALTLFITQERTEVMAFTRPYYLEPVTFVYRRPGPMPKWQAIMRPFTPHAWSLIFFFGLTAGLVLKAVNTSSLKSRSLIDQPVNDKDISTTSAVFKMMAGIFQEAVPIDLKSSSSRMWMSLWWIFCLLIITIYRGNLTAFLSVPGKAVTIDTLEKLLSSDLKFGMSTTYGATYQLFSTSTVPVYKEIFDNMEFLPEEISMNKVMQEKYAFIAWKLYLKNLIARDYTKPNGYTPIYMAHEEFYPNGCAWGFAKGSPYHGIFDRLFQRMIEGGVINKWISDLIENAAKVSISEEEPASLPKKEWAKDPAKEEKISMSMEHLIAAFVFIGISLLVSFLVFSIEMLTLNWSSNRQN